MRIHRRSLSVILLLLSACGSSISGAQNKDTQTTSTSAPSAATGDANQAGVSCTNPNQPIVANPNQPGGETAAYRWTLLPQIHELYSASGPNAFDPVGGVVNDSFFATLSSLAGSDPNTITQRIALVGQTSTGLQVYSVRLYDANNTPRDVRVNEELLSLDYTSSYPFDGFTLDDNNQGAVILWPSIMQKAAASLLGSYSALQALSGEQALQLVTGTPPTVVTGYDNLTTALRAAPQVPTLAVGSSAVPNSPPAGHFVQIINNDFLCDIFENNNYCVGPGAYVSVEGDVNGFVSLRGSVGGSSVTTTQGVQQHNVDDMPRVVFDVLFSQASVLNGAEAPRGSD